MSPMVIKTKETIIFIITILLIPLSTALNFTLNSPEKVFKEAEFLVTIIPQETANGSYDVKIFVHWHTKEFSEIFYNNQWKSPFNFLKEVFPSQTEFKLKSHYVGETKICAKLRNSERTSDLTEVCNNITVESSQENENVSNNNESNNENNNENRTNDKPKKENTEKQNKTETNEENNYELLNLQNSQSINKNPQKNEKIILNPKEIANTSENEKASSTKQEKIRLGIIYGFTFFCVVVIIFLALRKL